MIAKAVKGRGFRGVLNYDLNEEKGEILDTNMAGTTARELAQEFGVVRKLRPNLNKTVLHVSLSAAIGEHLTEDQWREIGHKYLKGMDLDNNQFVMTRHTDTDHEHIHIIANRIQFNGEVTSDSNDYRRQEVIMREIERDYGLQSVASSADAGRRAPSKGQIEREKRTGEPSTKQQLQAIIDQATADTPTFLVFASRLHRAEVSILPSGKTGTPQGISFELDGMAFKGSDLGKSYAWKQLQSRIDYEPTRDQSVIDALRQRDPLIFRYVTEIPPTEVETAVESEPVINSIENAAQIQAEKTAPEPIRISPSEALIKKRERENEERERRMRNGNGSTPENPEPTKTTAVAGKAGDVVKIAKERGWKTIKINGTDDFRRDVWFEAQIQGIETIGYTPAEFDKLLLAERKESAKTSQQEQQRQAEREQIEHKAKKAEQQPQTEQKARTRDDDLEM